MIHRAILGSVERMFAIMTEHTGGKWPFWISPRQAIVVPIHAEKFGAYAQEVRDKLHAEGFYCDVELSNRTLNKKVRESQLAQVCRDGDGGGGVKMGMGMAAVMVAILA